MFGLDADATPDQVFSQIAQQFGKTVNVTVTLDGSPISGVTVDGITTKDGGVCITNGSGVASGYCGTNTTKLTAKSIWLDVDDVSKIVDTSMVETDTSIAMTSKSTGTVKINNSKTVRFTNKRTSIQYYLIGGGAGGGVITTNISVTNTAHDGTLPGAAGGNVIVSGRISGGNNVSFKSSSGADDIVIFKWTT